MAVRLVIGAQGPEGLKRRTPDPTLVELMVKGKVWLHRLTFGGLGIGQIAEAEQLNPRYVSRVIHIGLLAPDIVRTIEQGDHPAELSATRLLTSVPFPMDWQAQRKVLGMRRSRASKAMQTGVLRHPGLLAAIEAPQAIPYRENRPTEKRPEDGPKNPARESE